MKNIKPYIFIFLFFILSILLHCCVTCTRRGKLVLTVTFPEERELLYDIHINDTIPSNWYVPNYSQCEDSVVYKTKEIKFHEWCAWYLKEMGQTDTLCLLLYSHEKLLKYCKGELSIESCYELYFFSRPYLDNNNWRIHIDADTKQRYLY